MPNGTIYINGNTVPFEAGETILSAAKRAGLGHLIPTLCHDERVQPYGSCGICAVEEEGKPRLIRACSVEATEGMRLITDSDRVARNRQTVLELLLSDHDGDCRPPCSLACPAETDCQGYVGLIANGQYKEAAELIREKLPLASAIGRVCPHPCEKACRRKLVEEPIDIAHLKYFATDQYLDESVATAAETGKTVAIIGGGPGGLAAAYFLRRLGHGVTLFEQMPEMGGMLRYGVPAYRLPREVLAKEVKIIENMGVVFKNNVTIGRDIDFKVIQKDFDAVVIAIGAWCSSKLGCPGDEGPGVVGGINFLKEAATHTAKRLDGQTIAVVGGSNTAMDVCRTALRLGASRVYNIYRRTKAEMPAEAIEIAEAEEEGVVFLNLANPLDITGTDGRLAVRLQKMALGEADASGRRAPEPIPGDEETLIADMVVAAIGQQVTATGFEALGALTKKGTIPVDETTFQTSTPGIFAIGDAVNKGPEIAVSAIGKARKASVYIDAYLRGVTFIYREPVLVERELTADDFKDREHVDRAVMEQLPVETRINNFDEINLGFDEATAKAEAARCLECGCHDYFECKLVRYANAYGAKVDKYAGYKHLRRVDTDEHPYILRNQDKCILCGLCARICDEAMDIGVFSLAGRGFDTQMLPSLGESLKSTDCVSCGQCVSACPTGALQERVIGRKAVPVDEGSTQTVCPGCSAGCLVKVTSKGGALLRVLPDTDRDKTAMLCEKGRFGYTLGTGKRRIAALGKINGAAYTLDVNTATKTAMAAIASIIQKYGNKAVAVVLSPSLTNEEIAAACELARMLGADLGALIDVTGGEKSRKELRKAMFTAAHSKKQPELGPDAEYPNTAGLRAVVGLVNGDEFFKKIGAQYKAVVALGETPAFDGSGLECLVLTESLESGINADIILPFAAAFENDGNYTGTDGVLLTAKSAFTPPSGMSNLEIIKGLAAAYVNSISLRVSDES